MNVFKRLRKEFGLTQMELAKELNIKQSTICKWETNKSFPDISTLKLLANFYKVDVSALIDGENAISDYACKNDEFSELSNEQKANLYLIKQLNTSNNLIANGYLLRLFQEQQNQNR